VLTSRWTKVAVFVVSLVPLALLLWAAYTDELGPNPLEYITRATGDWTLRFLLIALAVTPLRKLLRTPDLIRFRRMLGLYAFFYGSLHLLTYLWFDRIFEFAGIWEDIVKRPYITIGFTAWLLMLPLAVTSTAGWIRRLGGSRWRMLHRAAYVSAVCGVIHFYWLVKSDVRQPLLYAGILAALLALRVMANFATKPARGTATVSSSRL
jgi:methionine sulfoxide reductase heme-binding subunit